MKTHSGNAQLVLKFCRSLFCLLCFSLLGYSLIAHKADFFLAFRIVSVPMACFALGLTLLQLWIQCHRAKPLYEALGYRTPIGGLLTILARQNLLNYLPMKAGTVASGIEMHQAYGVSPVHFLSVFASQNLLLLSFGSLMAGLLLIPSAVGGGGWVPLILVGTFFVLSTVPAIALFLPLPTADRLPAALRKFTVGLSLLRFSPRLFLRVSGLTLVGLLVSAYRMKILYGLGGVGISLSQSIILWAFLLVSIFLSLTPAGLGIREALMEGGALALSLPPGTGLVVSCLERVATISAVAVVLLTDLGLRYSGRVLAKSSARANLSRRGHGNRTP